MRARRITDGGARDVPLPPHVSAIPGPAGLTARCAACKRGTDLSALDRSEAERRLGDFARWHASCAPRQPRKRRTRRAEQLTLAGLGAAGDPR